MTRNGGLGSLCDSRIKFHENVVACTSPSGMLNERPLQWAKGDRRLGLFDLPRHIRLVFAARHP
jgi:hypothetical protein